MSFFHTFSYFFEWFFYSNQQQMLIWYFFFVSSSATSSKTSTSSCTTCIQEGTRKLIRPGDHHFSTEWIHTMDQLGCSHRQERWFNSSVSRSTITFTQCCCHTRMNYVNSKVCCEWNKSKFNCEFMIILSTWLSYVNYFGIRNNQLAKVKMQEISVGDSVVTACSSMKSLDVSVAWFQPIYESPYI